MTYSTALMSLIFLLAVLVTVAWVGLAALVLWIDHRKRAGLPDTDQP